MDRLRAKYLGSGRSASVSLASAGIELAGILCGLTLLGLLLDHWLDTTPIFLLIGAGLGITGGMYQVIRRAGNMGKRNS